MLLRRLRWGISAHPRVTLDSAPLPMRMDTGTLASAAPAKDLHWVSQENREEVAHILDLAARAADRWDMSMTDFLTPAVAADAMSCLSGRSDLVAIAWGGYPQAERCRWEPSFSL